MENAAVKIQAACRGYQVRQCQPLRKLRQIADVRTKLKKLNMRACDPAYIDKLCSDPMENRKMKEEIMALLLELDAIQGVLPVVRKIRKSVTRDVVQFQEIVDAVKVDSLGRNDAEENFRSTGQVNARGSEQANLRASVPVNPPLRRVVSLDDNVYPEQSYAHRPTKKKPSDGAVGEGSNRSSDDDAGPRRRPEGLVTSPLLHRSVSGNQRSLATKAPLLARTVSEVHRKAGVLNPLLGRSISEVLRKPANKSPLLGRSISEVQRKKRDVNDFSSPCAVSDVHKNLHPKTSPISDDKVSSVDMDLPPPRHKSIPFGREEAAIRIQATYRGYLSRRSRPLQHLRTISVVNTRLRELNRQFGDPTCAERLRMDEMERLKWSEEITALLLKLDSVQGVVQVIRDIRKSVTREVIKLQEEVDGIVHEADILSRIAQRESDSSVASTEEFSFGTETSDQESQDHDQEGVRDSSPKPSAPFEAIVDNGHAQVQHDSRLWDDKYMDLQKPFNFGFDGSTVSCPSRKGNTEGELQPEKARVQRKMKRVLSGSSECRFPESQNAFEIERSNILSSGRFTTEDGWSLILSSSVSAAGTQTEGEQQPLVLKGGVNSQHPSLVRTQKKLKRIERVQNATGSGAVSRDSDSSAAVLQDQLTSNLNGYEEEPVEAVLDGIPRSGTSVRVAGDSNDVPMLPGEEFYSDREKQGGQNGRSPPRFVPCKHHLPEERACEFLRSRAGRCQQLGSGSGKICNGETVHEDNLPTTTTSEVPAVHRPSVDQWEVDRLDALMDENSKLRILLSQVLAHAEDQAHDLKLTKSRLAKLEKERVQHTKKDDTGARKKTTLVRRRRILSSGGGDTGLAAC